MTLQLLHSVFPYRCGKFDFLFYQCGVKTIQYTQFPHIYTVVPPPTFMMVLNGRLCLQSTQVYAFIGEVVRVKSENCIESRTGRRKTQILVSLWFTKPRVREKPKARGTSPDRSLAQLKERAEGIVLWKLQWVCHTACPECAVQLRAALSFSWQDLAFCARPDVIVEITTVGPSLRSSPCTHAVSHGMFVIYSKKTDASRGGLPPFCICEFQQHSLTFTHFSQCVHC